MIYKLERVRNEKEFTLGILSTYSNFICYTVERPWLNNQKGISCIPKGEYKIDFLKESTPLTLAYQERYDWFSYHIEIKDVPNRGNIYLHIGNWAKDVEGCVALGKTMTNNGVGNSRKAFEKFYRNFQPGEIIIL